MFERILTTKQHAAIDYLSAVAFPLLPRLFGWDAKARRVMDAVAGLATAQTAMTDFEGGVKGMLPMQAHLGMDALIGAGLLTAAVTLDDESPGTRLGLAAVGLFALGAALLTDPIPEGSGRSHAKRTARLIRDHAGERVGEFAGAGR